MSVSIAPYPRFKAFYPGTGTPLAGGQLWTLQPGTSGMGYLKATYTDSTGLVANTNPVALDTNGEADVWLSGYTKLVLYDAAGNLVWSRDNVSSMANVTPPAQSQWVNQALLFSYIPESSGTQFSTPGDQTAIFPAGIRLQAVISAGAIYGTVISSIAAGSPVVTTVTVGWDSTVLDGSLSAISTGIIPPGTSSFPYLVGEIIDWAGPQLPPGRFFWCDASAKSRTTYAELFNALTIQTTGSLHSNTTVDNIPSTADMGIGMPISGPNIPASTTIANVNSGTQITLSQAATGTASNVAIVVAPHGVGDGSTTFNVPDRRGRTPIGTGQGNTAEGGGTGTNRVLGTTGGAETHTQAWGELATHTHTINDPGHIHSYTYNGSMPGIIGGGTGQPAYPSGATTDTSGTGISVNNTGSGSPMPIMNPWDVTSFIIRY